MKRNLKQLEIEKSYFPQKSGTYLKRFQISANLQLCHTIPRDGNLSPLSLFRVDALDNKFEQSPTLKTLHSKSSAINSALILLFTRALFARGCSIPRMHLRSAAADCIFSGPEKVALDPLFVECGEWVNQECCCAAALGWQPQRNVRRRRLYCVCRMQWKRETLHLHSWSRFLQRALLFRGDKTQWRLLCLFRIIHTAGSRIYSLQFKRPLSLSMFSLTKH